MAISSAIKRSRSRSASLKKAESMAISSAIKRGRSRSASRSSLVSRSASRSRLTRASDRKVAAPITKRKTTGAGVDEVIFVDTVDLIEPSVNRSKRKKSYDTIVPISIDVTTNSKKRLLDQEDGLMSQAFKKVRNQLHLTANTLNDLSSTIKDTVTPIISNMKKQIDELKTQGPRKFQENCNFIQNYIERCTKSIGRQKLSTILVIVLAILSLVRSVFFSIPSTNKSYKMYPLPHTGSWHASNVDIDSIDTSFLVNEVEKKANNSYVASIRVDSAAENYLMPTNDTEITLRIPIAEVDVEVISAIHDGCVDTGASIDDDNGGGINAPRGDNYMMKKTLGHRLQRIKAKRG